MSRTEFWTAVGGIFAIMGFLVAIWIAGIADLRDRVTALEIENVALKCAISPEICREIVRPQ